MMTSGNSELWWWWWWWGRNPERRGPFNTSSQHHPSRQGTEGRSLPQSAKLFWIISNVLNVDGWCCEVVQQLGAVIRIQHSLPSCPLYRRVAKPWIALHISCILLAIMHVCHVCLISLKDVSYNPSVQSCANHRHTSLCFVRWTEPPGVTPCGGPGAAPPPRCARVLTFYTSSHTLSMGT